MADDTIKPKKKVWRTPEIYLLDTDNVKGGAGAAFKEGAPVGGGSYQLFNNPGSAYTKVLKAVWDNYHS